MAAPSDIEIENEHYQRILHGGVYTHSDMPGGIGALLAASARIFPPSMVSVRGYRYDESKNKLRSGGSDLEIRYDVIPITVVADANVSTSHFSSIAYATDVKHCNASHLRISYKEFQKAGLANYCFMLVVLGRHDRHTNAHYVMRDHGDRQRCVPSCEINDLFWCDTQEEAANMLAMY